MQGQLIVFKHHGPDVRAVGQHGDDKLHILHRLGRALASHGPRRFHFLQGCRAAVIYAQGMSGLQQVLRHGLSHDSQSNKRNFHCCFLLVIVDIY